MHNRALSVLAAAAVALALAGCGAQPPTGDALPPVKRPPRGDLVTHPTPTPRHRRPPRRAAPPVRLEIPAIGVDAPLIGLGLDVTGALAVPERFNVAGWWTGGARPGERGPAVIAGHVDSKTGPAVFYRLPRLRRGDAVIVHRRDGSSVRFTVTGSAHYPKTRFPTRRVYGPTRRPALRLITCSGVFDRSSGHYLDNTVVYASV